MRIKMNYKILYLIPIFIVSLAVYFAYYIYEAEAQMPAFVPLDHDYLIYKTGSVTNSINGTTGNIDFNGTDSGLVIQKTINAMKIGQTLYLKSARYDLTTDLYVNKSVAVSASSIGTGSTFSGARINTNNHSVIFTGDFIDWNYIWIDGPTNTNTDVIKIKTSTGFHSTFLKVTGSPNSIGVHFDGNGINTNGWFNIENLYIANSKVSLQFDNATQGHIGYSQLSAWYGNAIVFHETDNITFSHMSISTPQTGSGAGIIFGKSSTSNVRGEHFDYLTISTKTGQPSFIVNYAIPSYYPATTIDHFLSGSNPTYNNNSTHNSVIYFDALSKTWKGN